MSASSRVKVLHIWSPGRFSWLPLVVAVSEKGHGVIPALRAQLDDYGFQTIVGAGYPTDDQALIDEVGATIRPPRYAESVRSFSGSSQAPASAGRAVDVDRAPVPVLYVWCDTRGSWEPLLVAVSPLGREAAFSLGAHLQDAGFSTFLASLPRDEPWLVYATARSLPPPANAGFVDFAPDGVVSHAVH